MFLYGGHRVVGGTLTIADIARRAQGRARIDGLAKALAEPARLAALEDAALLGGQVLDETESRMLAASKVAPPQHSTDRRPGIIWA